MKLHEVNDKFFIQILKYSWVYLIQNQSQDCKSYNFHLCTLLIRTINKKEVTGCNGPSDVVSSWLTVVWESGTLALWNWRYKESRRHRGWRPQKLTAHMAKALRYADGARQGFLDDHVLMDNLLSTFWVNLRTTPIWKRSRKIRPKKDSYKEKTSTPRKRGSSPTTIKTEHHQKERYA